MVVTDAMPRIAVKQVTMCLVVAIQMQHVFDHHDIWNQTQQAMPPTITRSPLLKAQHADILTLMHSANSNI